MPISTHWADCPYCEELVDCGDLNEGPVNCPRCGKTSELEYNYRSCEMWEPALMMVETPDKPCP